MSDPPRPDLYISADIETDGPIPGPFSTLSLGLCLAGRYDGETFERLDEEPTVFYTELRPISENFEPEALAVNGLDRERLIAEGTPPEVAMRQAADWIAQAANGHRPVLVAYPVAFDWAFLHWYFVQFAGESPFGFSSCLDIRTLYQAQAGTVFDLAAERFMPESVRGTHPHTHHAADDAIEQGQLFNNLFEGVVRRRSRAAEPGAEWPPAPDWLREFAV